MSQFAGLDEDAVIACADLVGRTGATEFQIGYLSDTAPHQWYAHARYKGARISADDQPGPVEAADALSRRLLTGAQCQHCKGLVTLSNDGAPAYSRAHLVDGTPWNAEESGGASSCRWRRMGPKWTMGCES